MCNVQAVDLAYQKHIYVILIWSEIRIKWKLALARGNEYLRKLSKRSHSTRLRRNISNMLRKI